MGWKVAWSDRMVSMYASTLVLGLLWYPMRSRLKAMPWWGVLLLPMPLDGSTHLINPYVDMLLDNPPARSPGLKDRLELGLPPRMYYTQITWVDRLKTDEDGQVWYRVNEPYGSYGDILWARAQAFRPLTPEDMAPISPGVEDKRVRVNIAYQTLSYYEGNTEVYYGRISSEALWDAWGNRVDAWVTPVGTFPIWRKLVSLHMSGGTTGVGWDLPGLAGSRSSWAAGSPCTPLSGITTGANPCRAAA